MKLNGEWLLLALLFATMSSDTKPAAPGQGKGGGGGKPAPSSGKTAAMVKTFEPTTIPGAPSPPAQWVKTRLLVAQDTLDALVGSNPAYDVDEIALSVVAHWAIETNWGAAEYCYNLGGIHGQGDAGGFASTDAGQKVTFAAYSSLEAGAKAYAQLLWSKYRSCVMQLAENPDKPDWYVCLGTNGYYAKNPNAGALITNARAQVVTLSKGAA